MDRGRRVAVVLGIVLALGVRLLLTGEAKKPAPAAPVASEAPRVLPSAAPEPDPVADPDPEPEPAPEALPVHCGVEDEPSEVWALRGGRLARICKGGTEIFAFPGKTLVMSLPGQYGVMFRQDGGALLLQREGARQILDLTTRAIETLPPVPEGVDSVLSPSFEREAFSLEKTVSIRDLRGGREIVKLDAPAPTDRGLAWSPDSRLLLTLADGMTLWDAATGARLHTWAPAGFEWSEVEWAGDSKSFFLLQPGKETETKGHLQLWDVISWKHKDQDPVSAFTISDDGRYLLTSEPGWLRRIERKTGAVRVLEHEPGEAVTLHTGLSVSPDGRWLFTSLESAAGTRETLFDTESGQRVPWP